MKALRPRLLQWVKAESNWEILISHYNVYLKRKGTKIPKGLKENSHSQIQVFIYYLSLNTPPPQNK